MSVLFCKKKRNLSLLGVFYKFQDISLVSMALFVGFPIVKISHVRKISQGNMEKDTFEWCVGVETSTPL